MRRDLFLAGLFSLLACLFQSAATLVCRSWFLRLLLLKKTCCTVRARWALRFIPSIPRRYTGCRRRFIRTSNLGLSPGRTVEVAGEQEGVRLALPQQPAQRPETFMVRQTCQRNVLQAFSPLCMTIPYAAC